MPSAESFQMSRYGDAQHSLYTGAMSYSIPIYRYSDPDFDLPVSLEYNFDGYLPSKSSGTVGYGWHLECGGVITRTVRGVPDEEPSYGTETGPGGYILLLDTDRLNSPYIYLYNDKEVAANPTEYQNVFNEDQIKHTNLLTDMPVYGLVNEGFGGLETAPDVFHFSFPGCSGDFSFFPDGTIKCYNTSCPYGELTVDYIHKTAAHELGFSITDGRGYVYTFGVIENALEFSTSYSRRDEIIGKSLSSIKLTSIEAPNGRRVSFEYEHDTQANVSSSPSTYIYNTYSFRGVDGARSGNYSNDEIHSPQYSIAFGTPLKRVLIDNHEILLLNYADKQYDENASSYFTYSDSQYMINASYTRFHRAASPKRLSSITVRTFDNETVQTATLSHSYGNGVPKMFLSSIHLSTTGRYSFSYANNFTFPTTDTNSTDYWGYWNGKVSYQNLYNYIYWFNSVNVGSLYNQFLYDGIPFKDPDSNYAVAGTLLSICYPTGGYSSIEYEGNRASGRYDRMYSSEVMDMIDTPPGGSQDAGGVRVKKITDSCSGNNYTRYFRYTTTHSGPESSGIVFNMPRYSLGYSLSYSLGNQTGTVVSKIISSDVGTFLTGVPTVCYSKVWVDYPDGSYKSYAFNRYYPGNTNNGNWADNYRESAIQVKEKHLYHESDAISISYESANSLFMIPLDDYSCMRGKLLEEDTYDADGSLVKTVRNEWAPALVAQTSTIWYNALTKFFGCAYRCYSPMLTSTFTSTSWGGEYVNCTDAYEYNDFGQLSRTNSYGPANLCESTCYRYCHESGSATDSSRFASAVCDAVKTRTVNGTEYVTVSEHYGYTPSANHAQPVLATVFSIPVPVEVTSRDNLFSTGRVNAGQKIIHYQYDTKYRLSRIEYPGNAYTAYQWDETGRNLLKTEMNGPSQVTCYEWKDMIGLSRIINPNGRCEYYDYNSKGMLSSVRNTLNSTMMTYSYYFQNEN